MLVILALIIGGVYLYTTKDNTSDKYVVTFRTNAVSSNYAQGNTQIAVDSNADGVLECFSFSQMDSAFVGESKIAKTPEGWDVYSYRNDKVLIVAGLKWLYSPQQACIIPTTTDHVAGYQETLVKVV
jgi:hypothetical protein